MTVSQTSHTAGHLNCPACEFVRKSMIEPEAFRILPFGVAVESWKEAHSRHIGPGTIRHYKNTTKRLNSFFAELPLNKIHIGHIEEYQRMRKEGTCWTCHGVGMIDEPAGTQRCTECEGSGGGLKKAGAVCINHECNTLSQVLARAGLWAAMSDYYHPFPIPKSKRAIALTDEEVEHLFSIGIKPKWRVALLASIVSVNTTAGPSEMLNVQLGDLDIDDTPDPRIHIRYVFAETGKNAKRDRWIPLNEVALAAVRELREIAREKGASQPTDYLFPHRAANSCKNWDPTRHMYSYRKGWNGMRKEAAKTHPRLAIVGPYVLRHTIITRLLEDKATSEETVVALAGWVSAEMKKVYSHIRNTPLRSAVDRLVKLKPQETEPTPPPAKPPQSEPTPRHGRVLEFTVRHHRRRHFGG
jgi:integrase